VNIIREVGGRKGRFGIIKNASNAAFVISFVRKDAFSKAKMDFSRPIWTIVRDAAFVLTNAGLRQ
jgi:hypothetical protein